MGIAWSLPQFSWLLSSSNKRQEHQNVSFFIFCNTAVETAREKLIIGFNGSIIDNVPIKRDGVGNLPEWWIWHTFDTAGEPSKKRRQSHMSNTLAM
jgi:hypothetical protein